MKKIGLLMIGFCILISFASCEKDDNTIEPLYSEEGKVTDIDGNIYRTVKIGDQWWMAENLRVIRTPDGDTIPNSADNSDANKVSIYGRVYSWVEANNVTANDTKRGIAPEGWHIPTVDDWNILFEYLGGENEASNKLREMGIAHWASPNAGATNASGFTALPLYSGEGAFSYVHYNCSSGSLNSVVLPSLSEEKAYIIRWNENDDFQKTVRHPVRCVKD